LCQKSFPRLFRPRAWRPSESTLGDKHLTPDTLAVAEEAKRQYAEGKIELVQKRTARATDKRLGAFDYLAIKKREVRVPVANGERWKPKIIAQGHASYGRPKIRA